MPPALDPSTLQESARMPNGRNRHSMVKAANRDRCPDVESRFISELAKKAASPTCYGATGQKRAAMAPSGRDRDRARQRPHRNGRRGIGRGSVTELTGSVVSPALNGPPRQQRTGGLRTGGYRGGAAQRRHRDRRILGSRRIFISRVWP